MSFRLLKRVVSVISNLVTFGLNGLENRQSEINHSFNSDPHSIFGFPEMEGWCPSVPKIEVSTNCRITGVFLFSDWFISFSRKSIPSAKSSSLSELGPNRNKVRWSTHKVLPFLWTKEWPFPKESFRVTGITVMSVDSRKTLERYHDSV